MLEELKIFKKEFERIKKLGYVKANRSRSIGIENTFLSLVNSKQILHSNYYQIMMKTDLTRSYITLFKASPKGRSSDEVKRLRNTYGECDSILKKAKTLHAGVQANCYSLVGTRYLFKLEVDYEEEKIYLVITDQGRIFHERQVYWSFADLKKKIGKKFKNIILVKAWTKKVGRTEYYKFYDYDFYELKDFSTFLKLIEDGTIRVSFQVGIYRTGSKAGKMKDNGTVFEIQELDLNKLYQLIKMK